MLCWGCMGILVVCVAICRFIVELFAVCFCALLCVFFQLVCGVDFFPYWRLCAVVFGCVVGGFVLCCFCSYVCFLRL